MSSFAWNRWPVWGSAASPGRVLAAVTAAGLLVAACSTGEEPVDHAAAARAELAGQGVDDDVADCVVRLASGDLRRGPLPDLARQELVTQCRAARAAIVSDGIDAGPDPELALTDVPWTLGDDPTLDALWRECEAAHGAACDRLFEESPVGSEYEEFGVTCGRRPDVLDCAELDEPPEDDPAG